MTEAKTDDKALLDTALTAVQADFDGAGGARAETVAPKLGVTQDEARGLLDDLAKAKRVVKFREAEGQREYYRPR